MSGNESESEKKDIFTTEFKVEGKTGWTNMVFNGVGDDWQLGAGKCTFACQKPGMHSITFGGVTTIEQQTISLRLTIDGKETIFGANKYTSISVEGARTTYPLYASMMTKFAVGSVVALQIMAENDTPFSVRGNVELKLLISE